MGQHSGIVPAAAAGGFPGLLRGAALALLLGSVPGPAAASPAPAPAPAAFPGAAGYGAAATGWRGGRIVKVTSLADSGPGSLRACAAAAGPRLCLFEVGGTIVLDQPLFVAPQVYVAGQTAPGQGIQIRLGAAQNTPVILKNTHDVVLRFLKIRPGAPRRPSPSVDALTVENGRRLYLDHLSLAYATDEVFNIHVSDGGEASDITLAHSILAWGLDRANHPKGRHSKGALVCSAEGPAPRCGRITLWRNLVAHNRDRNPDAKPAGLGPVDVLNNVFYNPISQFGEFYNHYGDARISYAGNLALSGPSTIRRRPEAVQAFVQVPGHLLQIYAEGNLALDRRRCRRARPIAVLSPEAAALQVAAPAAPLSAPLLPAAELLEAVLAEAGDQTPARPRDSLDAELAAQVAECRGQVADSAAAAGGWPELAAARAAPDSDGDGLPDAWEAQVAGLDPAVPSDVWAPGPLPGYSHIEAWLAVLAGDAVLPGVQP